jgi:hypothetical protein
VGVGVREGVSVPVTVGVSVGVREGVGVPVGVGVGVGVPLPLVVGVCVGEGVGEREGVALAVAEGVGVFVPVGEREGVGVGEGVGEGLGEGVEVGEPPPRDGDLEGVRVGVFVREGEGEGVGLALRVLVTQPEALVVMEREPEKDCVRDTVVVVDWVMEREPEGVRGALGGREGAGEAEGFCVPSKEGWAEGVPWGAAGEAVPHAEGGGERVGEREGEREAVLVREWVGEVEVDLLPDNVALAGLLTWDGETDTVAGP